MSPGPNNQEQKNELRRRAEESLLARGPGQGRPPAPGELSEGDLLHLVHELQVHQVELEMQNEALQQSQAELSEARDRYFNLFDLAPMGYFLLDDEMVILAANLAGAELLGVPRGELHGKKLSGFVSAKDQDDFFRLSRQAYQAQGPAERELRMVKANGCQFYAHLNCVKEEEPGDHNGQLRLVVRDITERVQLSQQLVKNVAILAGAERIAHLGSWEWDSETDEVTFSDELQRIYGSEKNRFSMAEFLNLSHPDDRAAKREAIEKALAGAGQFRSEFRIIRQSDQAERYLLGSGEVIFRQTEAYEAVKPVKIYGATQDVTELKLNERSLSSYAARLEVLNRDLESFTYVASHDLQAPLRKIIKFGELVKARASAQLNDENKDYLDRMQRAAGRMQSLILDLLAYARVTNNLISFQPVDLNQTLQDVVDDLEECIQQSKGLVEVGELPVLSAEPILMQQLFQNLVGNALKFYAPEKPPRVKIEATSSNPDWVEIRVIDQGIGFDEQELERIFRPFERLHGQNQYAGTGIGLAICRRIVERHSGRLTARSKPGEGATFIVTLPVQARLQDISPY